MHSLSPAEPSTSLMAGGGVGIDMAAAMCHIISCHVILWCYILMYHVMSYFDVSIEREERGLRRERGEKRKRDSRGSKRREL